MGLSPEYYNECTQDVLNLYAEIEDRIIADVVRRIVKTGDITETAKWQIRQVQQMGLLYDDIIKEVAKSSGKTEQTIKKMFENAGVETVNNDNRIHIKAGKSPLDIRQSESMLQILNGVYKNSLTDLKNLTGTTAITSQTAYYQACNSAFMMVSSGAFSYQQALRTVIQEVADKGATVSYPSGHTDKLDVAVRRSLLTGIGLASRQISEENSKLCGCDLMEISAHSGARPSHASWQGQIVSLSGRRGYLSKSDIGFGTGAGFGGWNCRHDWYPFYEGISTRNYSQKDLDRLNAKDIKYNGKMYSEYEISQMLRKKEREIRALKREQVALKTAVNEGQTFLKSDLTALNSKIRDKSAQIQSFCNDTGYKRDRFREQVCGKTSVRHTSKNRQNGLTSVQNSGNIGSNDMPLNLRRTIQNLKDNINIKINTKVVNDYHFSDGTSNKSNNYVRNALVYAYSKDISFVYPKEYNLNMQTINLERAVRIFNDVPKSLLKFVKKIEFVDYRNPQDAYWEKTYHMEGFVSFATGGNKEICFWGTGTKTNDITILETYIHEIGHNFDNEIKISNSIEWQRAINDDLALSGKLSPTSYGTASNAEDFAESLAYYFVHSKNFVKQFPNRAKIIRRILNEQ